MRETKFYDFPVLSNGKSAIQAKYLELVRKYKNHEKLSREELDWMDWAEGILS